MSTSDPHDQPSDVVVEEGMVLVEGPGGLAITLSPDVAEETGRRLIEAARKARGDGPDQPSSGSR